MSDCYEYYFLLSAARPAQTNILIRPTNVHPDADLRDIKNSASSLVVATFSCRLSSRLLMLMMEIILSNFHTEREHKYLYIHISLSKAL